MTTTKRTATLLSAAALSVASICAHAAPVSIVSATLTDLYSATFDGALTPDGSFFIGDPSLNPRAISITPLGAGSGTIDYDGTTLTQLDISLPDMDLDILNPGDGTNTHIEARNSKGAIFTNLTNVPTMDTVAAFAGFQDDTTPAINVDFSTFNNIVDTCVGSLCALIGILDIDGVRYQLDGSITPAGGDLLTLTVQTGNNSIYTIDLVTASSTVVPVPAAVWLFGSGLLGLVGVARRKNQRSA